MPYRIFYTVVILLLFACNGNSDKKTATNKTDTVVQKKERTKDQPAETGNRKPPIINIVDTVSTKRIVICMKDSAANYDRIKIKLALIFGTKLAEMFKKNKIKPDGAPIAWYKNQKSPFYFEAGIPVNKRPTKLIKGVFIREIYADSIILAHFYGPYDLIPKGYEAIKEWIKDNGKLAKGAPYEIYITDPIDKKGKPADPYKVQTDIVFPRK